VNLNRPPGQAAYISYVSQVSGKNYDSKGTGHLIFAKIKEVNPSAVLDAKHFTGHAFRFTDMFLSVGQR